MKKILLLLMLAGFFVLSSCGSGKTISGTLVSEPDTGASPESSSSSGSLEAAETGSSSAPGSASAAVNNASLASTNRNLTEIRAIRKEFLDALNVTNQQTGYEYSENQTLMVGTVDMVKASVWKTYAMNGKNPVYSRSEEQIYKSETAKSLGRNLTETYFADGTLYTRAFAENVENPDGNTDTITKAAAAPADGKPVPAEYLSLAQDVILAVDSSVSGDQTAYTLTLDPVATRDPTVALLHSAPLSLALDAASFQIEYNILKAVKTGGAVTGITQTVKCSYGTDNLKTAQLTRVYQFSQLGSAAPPSPPEWTARAS